MPVVRCHKKWVGSASMLLLTLNAGSLFAQEVLEEVMVSARREAESMMDVPVAISAISGDSLVSAGVNAVGQIAQSVPNIYYSQNAISPGFAIRGLYTATTNYSVDTAVGISLDEVFLGSTRWLNAGQFDVERIEVLKGPQGTYFGKNTTAGLINIISKDPSREFEGYARGSYEFEQRERLIEGAVSGPLADNLSARIALRRLWSDGYLHNEQRNDREPGRGSTLGRLSVSWQPTDGLDILYKVQREDTKDQGTNQEVSVCSPGMRAAAASFSVNEDCKYNGKTSNGGSISGTPFTFGRNINDMSSWLHSLKIEAALGDYTLTSVTGFVDLKTDQYLDTGMWGLDYFNIVKLDKNKQFSQELRLNTPDFGPVRFVLGAYYANAKFETKDYQFYDPALFSTIPQLTANFGRAKHFEQENPTTAVFGEGTWEATDNLTVIVGARFTKDRKSADIEQTVGSLADPVSGTPAYANTLGFGPIPLTKRNRSVTNFSPAFTVQYALPDGQIYASYKEGFKSGGFDASLGNVGLLSPTTALPKSAFEFNDETAKSYELGFKIQTLNHRLRLTGAIYRTEFDDMQLSAVIPPATPIFLNAASARTQGAELEAMFAAGSGITLSAGLGYVDSKYGKYENAPCFTGQTAAQGCVGGIQDASGRTLAFAPKYSGNVGINWDGAVGNGLMLHLGSDVSYRSEHDIDTDYDPLVRQSGYALVNARVALSDTDDRWSVALAGRNLFDREYSVGAADVPFFSRSMTRFHGLPRTVQIQLETKF